MSLTEKKPWEKYTPKIAESDDLKPWEKYVPVEEKKNLVQNDSTIGTQTSKRGFEPFQSPVDTKTPSVLTPKGQAEYQEQVKDYVPPKEVKQPKEEVPDFYESVKNSLSNIGTGVQQFIPNTAIALSETLQGLLGKDLGSDFYRNIVGSANNPELDRQEAYAKLAELEPQFKKTRGLIESAEKFDVVGLAAATVDAMSSLVRTAITSVPTAGIGLASDMVGGSIASYNQEKAKSKGISVDELYKRGDNEFAIPATIGAIGTGLEAIGLKGTIGLINKKLTGSIAKKFATTFVDVNKEGLTEFTQTGLDAANNALAQGKSATEATKIAVDEMFSKKGLESYLMGAVGSAGAAGLGRVAKGMLPANKKTVTEATQKISEMESELNNPNISPATQEFISENIRENVLVIADAIESDADKVEGLSDEQRFTINSVNEVINSYEEVLSDPNASEQTKKLAQERISKLDLEVDNILEGKKVSAETESIIQSKVQPTEIEQIVEQPTQEQTPAQKGVKAEEVTPELRDVESTTKALETTLREDGKVDEDGFQYRNEKKVMPIVDTFTDKMNEDYQRDVFENEIKTPEKFVSEAYHAAKADGSNPELVAAVESLLSKEQTPAQQVEQLREQEQAELKAAIPNADQYLTDGKVDRDKITDSKDLKKFDEIYDKYDKLISPLLPKAEVPVSEIEKPQRERGSHKIVKSDENTTLDDMTKGGDLVPNDFYDKPQFYADINDKSSKESLAVIKKAKGNPDAEITIYRSVPQGVENIEEGDWVSLSPNYAKEHGMHPTDETQDMPVISMKVKAKDIVWDGNDVNEFAYFPISEQLKPQEDAVQVETTGQVPVQPEARVSEEVEQGKPEAKPKVVAEEGKEEVAKGFISTPVKSLTTSLKDFQGRAKEYSVQTYNRIINEAKSGILNISSIPPIQIWKNPKTNEFVILAGHSRAKAFTDLATGEIEISDKFKASDFQNINAQIVEANTLEEAKKIAQESNQGAVQTVVDNAKYVRENILPKAKNFSDIKKKLQDLYGKSWTRIYAYANLNPNGDAMSSLQAFTESLESSSDDVIKKVAEWTGRARADFPQLTNSHENEIFKYLLDNKKISTYSEFSDLLNRRINGIEQFKVSEPLNFAYRVGRGTLEQEQLEAINELKREQAQITAEIKSTQKTETDKGRRDAKISSLTKRAIEINTQIGDLEKKQKQAAEADKLQFDIFSQINTEIDNGKITNETADNFIQSETSAREIEPIVEDIESKAESTEKAELNEVIKKADELLSGEKSEKETLGKQETKAESVKKEFTEGKDLNRIFAESKKKYGDKEGSKYNDVVNRLVNPNQNTIIEVRSNGVVVKEGDKYLLKPFTNTDANYKKWELSRPLDVTDQYVTPKSEPKLTKIEELAQKRKEAFDIAVKVRALKIDTKGKSFDATLGLPVAIWNGAVETVASAIEAGVATVDAIKRGLNYIQKNYRGQWNKKEYNDRIIKELGLRGIEVNGQDLIVQPMEEKATVELINGFYSPLEKGIAEAKTDKATGKGWMKVLSGVTEGDELNYTGVKDFLESNADRPISRKELLDYMKDNRIEVVEVVLGNNNERRELVEKRNQAQRDEDYDLVVKYDNQLDKLPANASTKFEQYQLEGEKENYKEVLVTLPNQGVKPIGKWEFYEREGYTEKEFLDAPKEFQQKLFDKWKAETSLVVVNKKQQFKSSHFDEPNILVHLRMNTRTDTEGNKVLFLEEVQSDFGQSGKREGFFDEKRLRELDDKVSSGKELSKSEQTEYDRLDAIEQRGRTKIPSAPFVTDTNAWTKLGLKTALKEAVAQGADKLAWTTGEQQNDRYDLSKSVSKISLTKDNVLRAYGLNGEKIYDKKISSEKEIEDTFGKEAAQKLLEQPTQKVITDYDPKGIDGRELSGVDLKVGGKGMKGFYGSPSENKLGIVGNVAKSLFGQEPKTIEIESENFDNKKIQILADKYDVSWAMISKAVRTEDIEYQKEIGLTNEEVKIVQDYLKGSSTQYSIDITPELKQAVKSGLPLFKNNIVQATERRKEAKAKLDALNRNLGIYSDPKEKAKALFNYHKALVEEALAYIEAGVKTVQEFAKAIGEDVNDFVKDAWNEANGGKKKVESDFEETAPIFDEVKSDLKASPEFAKLAYTSIESNEFKNTLSNKERESGRELSKQEKEYRVKKILDTFQLGADIIEQAKQEFGDKYVDGLLAFIRDNAGTLGIDNTSLILLSLENDLNKQLLEDPENLTLKKQENLVQNITIKYQRTVARALGLGRLRQLARVGYDMEAVTDQFFTTKQLEGRRKVEKAIQSDMDAINAEAEAQEQETDDIIIEAPKVKRDSKAVKADIKAEIEKLRKGLIKSARGGGGAMSSIPYAEQVKVATPHIIKLTKLFAELGVTKVNEIASEILSAVKDIAPDITVQDIRDVIASESKTPKDKLAEAKERTKERIAELEQEIADKKKELKIRNKPETDAELVALQQQEKALKAVANQYLTQESIDRINEAKEKSVVTKLENELKDLDEQISKQEKVQKERKDPLSTPQIEQLKAIRKAKIDLLNQIDPNPKEFTKTALIEAGYGREITVTTKNGKEKRQVLDWKKLAGEEGSIDNITEIVEKTLKGKGFSDVQIERMKEAFVQEIKDLRADIVSKALKELERANTPKSPTSRKSSARRLAELYDLGLFDKNPDEFKYLLNKALGLSDIGQEAFFEAERFAASLKDLYSMNDNEFFTRQFIREINLKITKLLNKVAMQEGTNRFRFSQIVSEIFNLMLRTKLQSVRQFLDNQISGRQERVIQEIGRLLSGELSDKEFDALIRKYSKTIKADITKNAGLYFGEINTPFLTKSQIEDYINGLSKNRTYHYVVSVALAKSYLEGADSMNKAALTETFFRTALLKVMTDKTNLNRMTPDEASKYINEQLIGQKFEDALKESERIIDKINLDAGIEVLAKNKENIYRGAMDLVKANLLSGNVVTAEMIEAAYNAAYKIAGYGLGHEANNIISEQVNRFQAFIEEKIKKAIKEKEWNKAAMLTLTATFNRNILNPFVGGGTNWLVLGLQKQGLDIYSPLSMWLGKTMNKIDLANPNDVKRLEENLVEDFRRKTVTRRVLIGATASALITLSLIASGGDDEYEEFRKRNAWFRRYESTLIPQMTLMVLAYNRGEFAKWMADTWDKSAKYEAMPKISKAIKEFNKDTPPAREKALGQISNVVGGNFDLPLFSIRFVRDLEGIARGISGQPPMRSDYENVGILNGFFNYGALDYLGFRPDRTYMRSIEAVIPTKDKETISFLRDNDLNINSNSDEAVLRDGIKTYLSIKEAKKYDKLWSEEVYKSIKTNLPKLKDLNERQIKSFVSAIEYSATEKVQKEFGFQDPALQQIEISDVKYSLDKKQIEKRSKLIKEYIRDKKGSREFDEAFNKAVKDGRVVKTPEAKYKMLMSNAKAHATKEMKIILEGKTKTLQVAPK
jgi:hypothetical protein